MESSRGTFNYRDDFTELLFQPYSTEWGNNPPRARSDFFGGGGSDKPCL